MSSDKIAMQELLQFIFDRDAVDARESLHESIVEAILSSGRVLTVNSIMHETEKQFNIQVDTQFISQILSNLTGKGYVRNTGKNVFFLDFNRKRDIENRINQRKKDLSYFEATLVEIFKGQTKNLSIENNNIILDYFYHFCLRLFSLSSDLLISFLQCDGSIKGVESYLPPEKILFELLQGVDNEETKEAIKETFEIAFRDSSLSRFLSEIARNYLYFRILNLEPSCKSVQKSFFSEKIVFADTNFIMSVLLPNRVNHTAALRCLNLSKKLGVQFRYTKRCHQEFMEQLKQSKGRFKGLTNKNLDILSAIDDDFIADYAVGAKSGKRMDWDSYCIQFKILGNILKDFGIQEFSDMDLDIAIMTAPSFVKISEIVTVSALRYNNLKDVEIADHDAYHLMLVRKLREKEKEASALGPKFWFLTFDQSLLVADKEINRLLGATAELPSSIECWAWMNMISPFFAGTLAQESTDDAFVYLMKTNFRALPSRIKTKKLIAIAKNVNLDSYTIEEVNAIVNDAFVQAYSTEIERAKKSKNQEAEKIANNNFSNRVNEVTVGVKKSSSKKQSNVELLAKVCCIAIALVFMSVATYSYVVNNSNMGAIIFGLLSSFFMAMAIGYKQIELFVKGFKVKVKK